MRRLTDGEIERYVASGEPFDKAGGYAIQGRAAVFITRIDGSYSGRDGTAAGRNRRRARQDRPARAIRIRPYVDA